jgi:uncharacterized protein
MELLIEKVKSHVIEAFRHESSGHDWHHIERVYNVACFIQEKEGGDKEIIELAALLHDISDHKLNGGKLNAGGLVAFDLLIKFGCDPEKAEKIKSIVDAVSFKGAHVEDEMLSLEGKIVQDADRLDAIGAIGIARTFTYAATIQQPMYAPDSLPVMHSSFDEYASSKTNTINHFYEKLLLLKDRLHTTTARNIGQNRHELMVNFVREFEHEWKFNND